MRTSDSPAPALRLVVFSLEGLRCGLPLDAVERVYRMVAIARLPRGPEVVLGAINVHGEPLPVVDLRFRFGLPPRELRPERQLLIARTRRRRMALAVDEVVGVLEVAGGAVAPPEKVLPGVGHVVGVVALADGLLLIQDLETLLSLDEEARIEEALR